MTPYRPPKYAPKYKLHQLSKAQLERVIRTQVEVEIDKRKLALVAQLEKSAVVITREIIRLLFGK